MDQSKSNKGPAPVDLEEVVVENRKAKSERPGWNDSTRVKEPKRPRYIGYDREGKVKPNPEESHNSVRTAVAKTRIQEPRSQAHENVSSAGVASAKNTTGPGYGTSTGNESRDGNQLGPGSQTRTEKGTLGWDHSTAIEPPRRPTYITYEPEDNIKQEPEANSAAHTVDKTRRKPRSKTLALANVSSTGVGEVPARNENDGKVLIKVPKPKKRNQKRLSSLGLASSEGALKEAFLLASEQNEKENNFDLLRTGVMKERVPFERSGGTGRVESSILSLTKDQHTHVVHVGSRTRFRGDFLGSSSKIRKTKRFLVTLEEESSTPISSDRISGSSEQSSQGPGRGQTSQHDYSSSERLEQSSLRPELMWLKGDFPYEPSSESEAEPERMHRFNSYDPFKIMNSVFLFWLYALLLGRMPFTFELDRKRNSYVCVVDRTKSCYWWFIITSVLLLGLTGLCFYSTVQIIMIEPEPKTNKNITNNNGTNNKGTDVEDFHLLLGKLLMEKHWLYLIFFISSLFGALFVSLDVIFNGKMIAGCITEMLETMQSLNYDANLGIRRDVVVFLIMTNLRNGLSLFAFTIGPLEASVFKTFPEAMHLLTICLFRPLAHDIRSYEPYFSTIMTVTSFVLYLYATLCSRTMIIIGMMMAKGVENIANEWSFRLGLKLGLVTMTSHDTELIVISSLRYKKLFEQHNLIVQLIRSMSAAFGLTIICFYLVQMIILTAELFYVSIVFVREPYASELTTALSKPVNVSGHVYEYLDGSIISILPGILYVIIGFASFWHTSVYFCEAGDAVMNGFYYVRRHSLVMCQKGREMQFILSLMVKFSDRCKYYINPRGYFPINREFVFYFLLTAITLFSVMIQCKIKPLVTVPLVVPCVPGQLCADGSECPLSGLCKSSASFLADKIEEYPHHIVTPRPPSPTSATTKPTTKSTTTTTATTSRPTTTTSRPTTTTSRPITTTSTTTTTTSRTTTTTSTTTATTSRTTTTTSTTTKTTTTKPPKKIRCYSKSKPLGHLNQCWGTGVFRPKIFDKDGTERPFTVTITCVYDPYGPEFGKPGLNESTMSQYTDCYGDPITKLDFLGIPIVDYLNHTLLSIGTISTGKYFELTGSFISNYASSDYCVKYNPRPDRPFEICGLLYTTFAHVLLWRMDPTRPSLTEYQFKDNNARLPGPPPLTPPPVQSCANVEQLEAERVAGIDTEFWTKAPLTRSSEPHAMYRNPYLNTWSQQGSPTPTLVLKVTVLKLSLLDGLSFDDNLHPYEFINSNLFPQRPDGLWETFLVDCDGTQLLMDDCGGLKFKKYNSVTGVYSHDEVTTVTLTIPDSSVSYVNRTCLDWNITTEECGVPKDVTKLKCIIRNNFLIKITNVMRSG